jgi:hypothetical protein
VSLSQLLTRVAMRKQAAVTAVAVAIRRNVVT